MVTASKTFTEEFLENGFVIAEGVLDPETVLEPIIHEYHGVLDRLASELYETGKISSKYESLSFDKRLIKICGQFHWVKLHHISSKSSTS